MFLIGPIRFSIDPRGHALWLAAFYKTLVYTFVTYLVIVAEKIFHAYREGDGLAESLAHVSERCDRNVMLATVLCVGLAFAVYNLYSAVDRRLGESTLRQWIWKRPADDQR